MGNISIEERRQVYNEYLAKLRKDKILETKKKLDYYGYMDEDDYNFLMPPDGYDWEPKATHENGDFHGFKAWAENYKAMTESFPPVVVPYSSMAGNFYKILQRYRKLRWHPDLDFEGMMPLIEKYNIDHGVGQVHHFCGDISIGFELGWGGLLKKLRHYAKLNAHDEVTKEFYSAEEMLVESIISWVKRTSDCIRNKMLEEKDPLIKENLAGMLEANEWVEEKPPQTLRQACQFICWYNIAGRSYNREGAGGQLDALLYPYYERDKKSGLIDGEDAIYYIAGVLLSDTKYYQLGGPDKNGKDMVSPVSWLILEAAHRLDITANLTVRVHDGLDREFFKRAVELLFEHENGWPRFSGDKSLVSGFVKNGFSEEIARKRVAVGCNWMAMPGLEYCLNDSIKVNFAKVFEVAFYEMMDSDCSKSTAKLWALFIKHLGIVLDVVFRSTDLHIRTNKENSPELFLNLFCCGPIEKGRDASDHSLDYYTIGVEGAAIAVAADSFAALEQRIEKESRMTWEQIDSALRNNYKSEDGLYVRNLMKTAQKFGQLNSFGQVWAVKISEVFTSMVVEGESSERVQFLPALFSWSKTIYFGENVGATPDGRLASSPINHGANPMPGSVKNGEMTALSEAIVSVQCTRGNTAPFQMELDPGITKAQGGVEKIMALMETHLDRGGTLINVNIMNAEKIREAHKNPELYPDLVVRVTGFTAYFITLSPEFRQLVVDRLMEAQ